jgi:hypothetical protein
MTVGSEREIAPALENFATAGDIVVCLGAGNSTEWAHALPRVARRRAQARRRRGMSFPDLLPEIAAWMPQLRGRVIANATLADITWFRVGGPAQVLFTPADEPDLAYFLRQLPREIPVVVIDSARICWCATAACRGVVVRLGRGFAQGRDRGRGHRLRAGAVVPRRQARRGRRQDAGIAAWRSIAACLARSAARLRMNAGRPRPRDEGRCWSRPTRRRPRRQAATCIPLEAMAAHLSSTAAVPHDWIFTERAVPGQPRRARRDPRADGRRWPSTVRPISRSGERTGRLNLQESRRAPAPGS